MLGRKLIEAGTNRPLPQFVSASSGRLSSRSVTLSAPSGIQDGDLLVFVGMNDSTSPIFQSLPTGFNARATRAGSTLAMAIAVKVASSESGSYFFEFASGTSGAAALLVYRNATRLNTAGDMANVSAASVTAAGITPTYNGTLVVAFANETSAAAGISTPPSGLTNRVNLTGAGAGQAIAVYDLSPQSATATSDYTLTWSGSGGLGALQFQLTNEPDVEPDFIGMAQTQNVTSGASLVINKPTGTVEGDLMVAVMAGNVSATFTGDTDWTEIADQGVSPSLRVAYKVAGASEGASYTFTSSSSSTTLTGAILTYRYAAYDTIAGSFTTGADPLILTSISPTASQSILIAAGATGGAGGIIGTPISMTMRATDTDGTKANYTVSDQSVAAGPTGNRVMSTGSTAGVAGILLSIKPTRSLY